MKLETRGGGDLCWFKRRNIRGKRHVTRGNITKLLLLLLSSSSSSPPSPLCMVKVKVKVFRYKPEVALGVPGG